MCGIAGIVEPSGLAPRWKEDLRALDRSIRHRGPDDHGFVTDQHVGEVPDRIDSWMQEVVSPRVVFAHRRLSIIDLSSAARQPMVRSKVFLTYNGELYNYRELRRELELRGATFRTQSDTEVVLEAYRHWGIQSVSRFRGIFAYALADMRAGKVYLVRDHLGVKPLYYAHCDNRWVFSSELKSFKTISDFRIEFDPLALRKYLRFLWIPGEHTGFKSVQKLPPGTWLEVDIATASARKHLYWSPLETKRAPLRTTAAEAAEYLRTEIGRTVQQQLVSDVPVGAFLSGGVDSSLIVAAMSQLEGRAPSTYSIGYKADDLAFDIVPDDLPYARRVSEHFQTQSTEIVLSPDVATLLPTLVDTLDEPLGDPAAISSYLICKEAKRTLTVMLSGMGADELFAGYPRQRALAYGQVYRRLPRFARSATELVVRSLPGAGATRRAKLGRAAKKFLASVESDPLYHYIGMETYFDEHLQRELLHADSPIAQSAESEADELDALAAHITSVANNDPLREALMWDLVTYLPCLNLAYTDRTSMAHAVEVRVPFLDVDLVEWSISLATEDLLNRRHGKLHGKWVLKQAAESLLPSDVIWRKKAGFGAPVRAWLRNDLAEMREELLGPKGLASRGWFEPRALRRLQDDFLSGRADYSLHIWMLLSLELWLRSASKVSTSAPG